MEPLRRPSAIQLKQSSRKKKSNEWVITKVALIKAFKDHRPYKDIIKQVRDTPYQGSISKFVNELKTRSSKVHTKLELESDQTDKLICTSSPKKTIRDCIERKLPDRLYNSLPKKDITTNANLQQAAMVLGHWDVDPFDNYKPRRYDRRINSGNTHQNYYCQGNNSNSFSVPRNINNSNNSTSP